MLNSVDVLVVGAGPVGLTMALALQKQGITSKIIDNKSGPSVTSNAIGVNARTLEIWQAMGFATDAVEQGLKLKEVKLFSGEKLLNHAPFDKVDSEFNFMLSLPQSQTESLLISQLNQGDTHVQWGARLVALEDTVDGVNVTYEKDGKSESLNAKWVVGCDGYHSSVRDLAKFEREHKELQQHFIMMDAKLEWNPGFDEISAVFHNSGVVLFMPMKNKVRVVAEISNDPKYKNIKEATREVFTDILNERYPGMNIQSIDWLSDFHIHESLVKNFSKGHVFLAGDAAHSHSPAGGQGMNTGIQDSWNLAWKLAHVIKKEASVQLLDSYDIERRGLANDVLKRSGGLTKIATTNNKFVQLLRNLGVGGILSIDLVRKKIVNGLSQTDICYLNSPLIDSNQVLYQNKTKYPLVGTNWLLLSKDPVIHPNLPNFVTIEHNPVSWSDQPLCLVRPDGYIAMYADALFEISGYFIEHGIGQA